MFGEKVLLFLALLSECLSRLSFGGYSSALHVRILIGRFKDVTSVAPSRCSGFLYIRSSKNGFVLPQLYSTTGADI